MSFIRKRKRNGKVYLEEVKSIRVDGKVVQKYIRYIGREADSKTILASSISNVSIEKIKIYGPLLILNHIAKEVALTTLLGEYGNEILSLVFADCMDYQSINQMSQWFDRTDLNMMLDLEGLTEARLLKALDSIEPNIENIQRKIYEKTTELYKLDVKGIIYDVTNTYLYGRKCPLGKLGKDKEGVKGRPLIQIGLGVTQKEGIPLFHKTFDGNISDSRTLNDLITSFKEYNINKGLIIDDRGITSENNVENARKLNWHTICGLATNSKLKAETRKVVVGNKLSDIKKRVKLNGSIFYVFDMKYKVGDTAGKLLICYNEQKKKDLREFRYDEILNAQKSFNNGKSVKDGLRKFLHNNGTLKHKEIEKAEEFDGYSYIFSTKSIPNKEIMKLYFQDKDNVEKAFQSLKGVVKLRPIRHWLHNRVTAHIFICYLAYLLLSILKMKLKTIEISPTKALKELDSLYKIYIKDKAKDFKLERTVALTKKQENILKTIDKSLLTQCSG